MLATAFFTLFIGVQLFAWIFTPQFNQGVEVGYLARTANETYEIPISSFLPTVAVVENFTGLAD